MVSRNTMSILTQKQIFILIMTGLLILGILLGLEQILGSNCDC